MSHIKLQFDKKSPDLLIWNGQVVMSRTEAEYFEAIFSSLSYMRPRRVMEVGFGLGISATLIQQYFQPVSHDIFEIEESIFLDLQEFAGKRKGVRPFLGDWRSFSNQEKYDFIFYDPFDYATTEQDKDNEKSYLMRQLLKPSGILCHPHFGDGEVPDIQGFNTTIVQRMKVSPIIMADETTCSDVAIVYHRPI